LFVIIILAVSSSSSIAATTEPSDKTEEPSALPPAWVEFVKDPLPIPRRTIVFDVYSNDPSLFSVNIEIIYKCSGRVLYSEQGSIPVSASRPHTKSLELPFYGFLQEGKISVRIWKEGQFDWTFPAKTFGIFCYVCLF